MKTLIILLLLSVSALAAEMEVTLDAPVTITKTTIVEESASVVTVRYIVIDLQNRQIEIEFAGVSNRLVHKLTDPQYNNFRTTFVASYGTILKAMIVKHFEPAPEE